MAVAVLQVVQAGPHVSIQDAGRPGLMRFGVPRSGPMDRGAFAAANAALGNPDGRAGLEVSLGGLALECVEGAVAIALAGGAFEARLDGETFGVWAARTLRAGQRLTIAAGRWGSWTYLAFAGRLRARAWLGSVSTHAPSGLGGGKVEVGQHLVIDDVEAGRERDFPCPVFARPNHGPRIVLGPQDRFFAPETLSRLLEEPFVLTSAYDRMGVRLSGPALPILGALDMPSQGLVRGSIQVGGDGRATVLMADHQTTGGYPKIAAILGDDLDAVAQLRARDPVRFRAIDAEQAVADVRTGRLARARYLASLRE